MAVVILGIDTSSALTSVAVVDGTTLVAQRSHRDARRHAEVIGPMLAEVVALVDRDRVTAVACGVGPGAYTGLRVGIASAIAVGAAWGVPVHGICSLDAVAAADRAEHGGRPITVTVDARRSEVYWARYGSDGRRVEGPRVGPADLAPTDSVTADPTGEWVARLVQALVSAGAEPPRGELPLDVHGEDTGATADALSGAGLLLPRPLYLRRPDAVATPPAGGA